VQIVDVEQTDHRGHTAEDTDDENENHGILVSATHVGFADDQDRERHKDPISQSVHDAVDVIHRAKSTPCYAFALHFVDEVLRRIAALEDGDEEEAKGVDREDDGADDDDLTLPLGQNLVT